MNLTYVLEVQNFYSYVVIKPYTHMEHFVKACDFNLHISKHAVANQTIWDNRTCDIPQSLTSQKCTTP